MEIQLNIWNASTWQCWWFTTWRCRWSERRTDGWTLVFSPCNAKKEIECISIPKSPTEPNFDFVLTIPLIEFKNPRIQESKVLWFCGITTSRLKTWNFCTASRESFEFCWRWDRCQGMLMKEKMRGLRWWKLKKSDRKKETRDGITKASSKVVKVYLSLWDVCLWNFWKQPPDISWQHGQWVLPLNK